MEETERYKKGWEILETVDGRAGDRVMEDVGSISPDMARFIVEYAYGDVWSRPGLDLKHRELATTSALITLGHCEPEMKVHMNGMLRVGWTREEIIEVIIQLSVYVGFPTALDALRVAGEVFAEADAS